MESRESASTSQGVSALLYAIAHEHAPTETHEATIYETALSARSNQTNDNERQRLCIIRNDQPSEQIEATAYHTHSTDPTPPTSYLRVLAAPISLPGHDANPL